MIIYRQDVTTENLGSLAKDDSVYVITKGDAFDRDRLKMRPIKDVRIEDVLAEDSIVVTIMQ